jgi:hypothetical protein
MYDENKICMALHLLRKGNITLIDCMQYIENVFNGDESTIQEFMCDYNIEYKDNNTLD